ncbi:MAG TPA: hypothetical protein VFZ48_04965 [Candidatus Saccharimonadales bacterium]
MHRSGLSQKLYSSQRVIRRAVLRPKESISLLLGVYEDLIPQPSFSIQANGSLKGIRADLVRIDERGDYRLSYRLQNTSDEEREVIVTEKDA